MMNKRCKYKKNDVKAIYKGYNRLWYKIYIILIIIYYNNILIYPLYPLYIRRKRIYLK